MQIQSWENVCVVLKKAAEKRETVEESEDQATRAQLTVIPTLFGARSGTEQDKGRRHSINSISFALG